MNELEVKLGKWIFEKDFWQIRLEDENGINSFASERGVSSFRMWKDIEILWQLGLLKADLIRSSDELNLEGIEYLGEEYFDEKYYSDLRETKIPAKGLIDSAKESSETDKEIKLYFHPFRFFVLYHLEKILKIEYMSIQPIINSEGFDTILEWNIENIRRRTNQVQFVKDLMFWNLTVDLCIALEPCFYQVLFNRVKHSPRKGYEEHLNEVSKHWEELEPILKNIGLDQIERMRADLCVSAEMLDRNREIHTLLRLTREEKSFVIPCESTPPAS